MDWTDVGRLAGDRSGWKKLVKERMDHLYLYERQLLHGVRMKGWEERLVRNERRVNDDLRCRYEGCERMCKLRASLVRHESMMQRRVERRVRFACEDCGLEVATKGALVSHRRTCGRGQVGRRAKGVWEVWGFVYPTQTSPVTYGRAGRRGWGQQRGVGGVGGGGRHRGSGGCGRGRLVGADAVGSG